MNRLGVGHRQQRTPTSRRPRTGTTLMELMVATVIITVGLLAMVSTSAAVLRMITAGGTANRAALTAFSRFEYVRSLDCKTLTGGTAAANGITEAWSVTDSGRRKFVVDTLTYRTPRLKTVIYRSMVSC